MYEDLNALEYLLLNAGPGRLAMRQRFIGHCNVQTDIKEAIFFGDDDKYVAAGLRLRLLLEQLDILRAWTSLNRCSEKF
jgi:hypothetical protein